MLKILWMKKWISLLLVFNLLLLHFAQEMDSVKIENKRLEFQYKNLYFPVGLMIAGITTDGNGSGSIKNEIVKYRNEHLPGFQNRFDDYVQMFPFAAVYGFEWIGMKPRTDWKNRTAILIKGQLLNLGMVYLLKTTLNETRPDGTAYSFPSGHVANAFAGAAMLSIEYGENHRWVPYAAYGVAAGVGVMRIANNRHYISDVLFGAGLGILSMKVAYWTHQYQWNQHKSIKDPFLGSIY